jgi:putative colanic acid biosynthesis UDP-glucose lipid carrier transferase
MQPRGETDAHREKGWVHAHGPALVHTLRVADAATFVLSLHFVCNLFGRSWTRELLLLALLGAACFTIVASVIVLYRSWRAAAIGTELMHVLLCCAGAVFLATVPVWMFGPRAPDWALNVMGVWGVTAFAAIGAGRIVVRLGLRAWRTRGRNYRTAAIVGATPAAEHLVRELRRNRWMGLRVAGIFDERENGRLPVAGDFEKLKQLARAGAVDMVYVALPLHEQPRIREIVHELRDSTVSVSFVADFSDYATLCPRCDVLGGMLTVSLVDTPHIGTGALAKRVIDLAVGTIALFGLFVPMLVIAVAVKATSPGRVLFRQRRYGLDGKSFHIWKFRTMTVVEDGETNFTFTQAARGDMRMSPIGGFLRRTSLDELPQLFNVLKGNMSLVGPRPHPVALNEQHRKLIDGYMLRHKVKPGITGWAQVHGFRGETCTPELMRRRVEYDLQYINDWSLWLDVRILWRTFIMVLRDPNAF